MTTGPAAVRETARWQRARAACAAVALLVLSLACVPFGAAASGQVSPAPQPLIILTYHDIVADGQALTNVDAVSVSRLSHHFGWLATSGYTPVTLAMLDEVRAGRAKLPARAVLLMFDDAYASFYERVLPLLRAYRFPAVLSVVGSWLHTHGERHADERGEPGASRIHAALMSAEQVREAARSGWVELASHTYDLHRGVPIDPYGAELPAASALAFDAATGAFETPAAFEARIRTDLRASREQLRALTGQDIFALTWPYGQSNAAAERIAAEEGFRFTFSLREGLADLTKGTQSLPRKYVMRDPAMAELSWYATREAGQVRRAQFMQLPAFAVSGHDLMLAREQAVAEAQARADTQVILLTAGLSSLGRCEPAALAPLSAGVYAQVTHIAWHLARRAGASPYLALPDPACLTPSAWRALVAQRLEHRPLQGAFVVYGEHERASSVRHEALQWLRVQYPNLTVFAPDASEKFAHNVRVLQPCAQAPAEEGVLALVSDDERCPAQQALAQLASLGWRWLGRVEPLELVRSHRAPVLESAHVQP
jgi:peptidoglycan/xylan/chitin deacetylase (PgdA/CDA1 family)